MSKRGEKHICILRRKIRLNSLGMLRLKSYGVYHSTSFELASSIFPYFSAFLASLGRSGHGEKEEGDR